jgi:hypothetical protein
MPSVSEKWVMLNSALVSAAVVSAGSNNATVVKASAGLLYGWSVNNINAAVRYLKFYDKASAPAPATDAEALVVAVAAASGQTVMLPVPLRKIARAPASLRRPVVWVRGVLATMTP